MVWKLTPRQSAAVHRLVQKACANCCFPTGNLAYDAEPLFTGEMLTLGCKYYLIGKSTRNFFRTRHGTRTTMYSLLRRWQKSFGGNGEHRSRRFEDHPLRGGGVCERHLSQATGTRL